MLPRLNPFESFTDTNGDPLDGGYVYIGTANQNPKTSPITVYFDSAMTIPAPQPLRTTAGRIVRSGSPAAIYSNASTFSILIENKSGQQVAFTAEAESDPASNMADLAASSGSSLVGFLQSGVGAVARTLQAKSRDTVSVKDFGAVGNGVTDDTAAIQAAVNAVRANGGGTVEFQPGQYLVSTTIDLHQGSALNIQIKGSGRGATTIRTTSNIVVFNHAESCVFQDFTIEQAGTAKTGRAFSTPTNKQAAYCVYERLSVDGFKFGAWWRYSLWNSVRDVRFNDCGAGIKASRNAFPDDQTNPAAPGSWNVDPGFFHNQNMFENVLCNGGEVGIYGTFNGCVFDNVTCQGQSDASGASNVVLPVGEPGVGMWLQGSASATGSRFGSQSNIISNYYSEFTRQPLIFDRSQVRLDSFFAQGGSSGDKYPQVIRAINGAEVNGDGCAASGSDWFNYRVNAVDSTLYGDIGVGSVSGNVSSLTDSTWYKNSGSGTGTNLTFTLTGSGLTQTLYTIPRRIGAVEVVCTVLRDGSAIRYGRWTVYFWQSGISQVVADPGNVLAATITLSGSDIIYTTTESLSHSVVAHVIPLALLGQTRSTGLYDVP